MAASKKWIRSALLILLILLVATGVFLSYYLKTLTPRLKQRVVAALAERFDADIQLDDLQASLFPVASVTGTGLIINHKGWKNDAHPLIRIKRFEASTDYTTLLDWRNRVNSVRLVGLEIHIPPKGRAVLSKSTEANQEVSSAEPGNDRTRLKFLIENIIADGTLLEIEPKTAGKDPLQFPISKLSLHSVGPGEAMAFTAELMNAKPPGLINSSGHFGPWQKDDPRSTAVRGIYTFRNADLGVFNGIRGILSSQGKYGGVLQHIAVDGITDTPDFALTGGGSPVHLKTHFHSVVDGMNGDTILDPVDATFLNSEFICSGGVVKQELNKPGKTVNLDAYTKHARMEDILTLIVRGAPLLKGDMQFRSKIIIPPGKAQVVDKLKLDGQFQLSSATFTGDQVEQRLRMLSDRAQGINKKEEEKGEGMKGLVASNMTGRFRLDQAVLSLLQLDFSLPGAHLKLAGSYNLDSTAVDMKGTFAMQARLSDTQPGLKHVLLRPFDHFFEKDGAGFEVPISIGGTKEKPVIGVSAFRKTFVIH